MYIYYISTRVVNIISVELKLAKWQRSMGVTRLYTFDLFIGTPKKNNTIVPHTLYRHTYTHKTFNL